MYLSLWFALSYVSYIIITYCVYAQNIVKDFRPFVFKKKK